MCINPHPIAGCKSFLKSIETDVFLKKINQNILKNQNLKKGRKENLKYLVPVFSEWWKPELFLCPGSWNNIGKGLQGPIDW